MRQFLVSYTGVSLDWLIYTATLLVVCFLIGVFVVWFKIFRHGGKKRRKRRHHHHKSPTLAEIGGLPPRREKKETDSPPPT